MAFLNSVHRQNYIYMENKKKKRQSKQKTSHMTSAHTNNMLWWNPLTHNRWQNTQTSIQPMSVLQEVPGVRELPHPELLKTKSVNLAGPGRHLSTHLSTHTTAAKLRCVRIELKEAKCFSETVPKYSATNSTQDEKSRLCNSGLCIEFSEVSTHFFGLLPLNIYLKKKKPLEHWPNCGIQFNYGKLPVEIEIIFST